MLIEHIEQIEHEIQMQMSRDCDVFPYSTVIYSIDLGKRKSSYISLLCNEEIK